MSKFHDILLPIAELLDKKNADYRDSYRLLREEYGPVAFEIRLSDKISRVKQLGKADALVKDESRIDTIKDIIGYCALELAFQQGQAPEVRKCDYTSKECANKRCEFDLAYKAECRDNYFCHHQGEKVERSCENCEWFDLGSPNNCGNTKIHIPFACKAMLYGWQPKEDK